MKKFVTIMFLTTIALAIVLAPPVWCGKKPLLKPKQSYQVVIDVNPTEEGIQTSWNMPEPPAGFSDIIVNVVITVTDDPNFLWNAADIKIDVSGAGSPLTVGGSAVYPNDNWAQASAPDTLNVGVSDTLISILGGYPGINFANGEQIFVPVKWTSMGAAEGTISFSPQEGGKVSTQTREVVVTGVDSTLSWGTGPTNTPTPTVDTPTPSTPTNTPTPTETQSVTPTWTPTEATPTPTEAVLGVLFVDRYGGLHGMNYEVPQQMKDDLIAGFAYWNWDIGRDFELFSGGGIIHMDGFGGVHFGMASAIPGGPYFFDYSQNPPVGTDKAIDLELVMNETGYILLDTNGVLYPVGTSDYNAMISAAGNYLAEGAKAVDMEFTTAYDGIYILDDMGNIYGLGNVIALPTEPMISGNGDLKTIDLELDPDGMGLYILDTYGDIHVWPTTAGPKPIPNVNYFGWDVAEDLEVIKWEGGTGAAVLDALGIVHVYGSIVDTLTGTQPYFFGWDVAEGLEFVVPD